MDQEYGEEVLYDLNSEPKYDGGPDRNARLTSKCKEKKLSAVLEICKNITLTSRYTPCQLTTHENYIEERVNMIRDKLGTLYPFFKVFKVLPNGSYYHGMKICDPDEKDYLAILGLSQNKAMAIVELNRDKPQVEIIDKQLAENINDTCKKLGCSVLSYPIRGKFLLGDIRIYLHKAVHACLSKLSEEGKVIYKGRRDTKKSNIDGSVLSPDEIEMEHEWNKPCVKLRMGAELCTVDVDIAFCLVVPDDLHRLQQSAESQKPQSDTQNSSNDQHELAGSRPKEPSSKYGCRIVLPVVQTRYWRKSFYEFPEPGLLNKPHRHIVMVVKYIMLLCNREGFCRTRFSSYSFQTVVRHHQATCLHQERRARSQIDHQKARCFPSGEGTLGSCLFDVAQRVMNLIDLSEKDNIVTVGNRLTNLPDANVVENNVLSNNIPYLMDKLFAIVLFIWIDTLKSSDEWLTGPQYRDSLQSLVGIVTSLFIESCRNVYKEEYRDIDGSLDPLVQINKLQRLISNKENVPPNIPVDITSLLKQLSER
ncbi:unnamed protein product [Owenia fusiformis]|uniref:Uncharacterized protein n=1 Tax=Owenia fusiformis TaxID=6347 RepID=A0A8J1UIR8_OWEFU|nr:unnamed protein product [Owenia fusiformis]